MAAAGDDAAAGEAAAAAAAVEQRRRRQAQMDAKMQAVQAQSSLQMQLLPPAGMTTMQQKLWRNRQHPSERRLVLVLVLVLQSHLHRMNLAVSGDAHPQ